MLISLPFFHKTALLRLSNVAYRNPIPLRNTLQVAANPKHAYGWYNLAVLLEDKGEFEGAEEAFQESLASKEDDPVRFCGSGVPRTDDLTERHRPLRRCGRLRYRVGFHHGVVFAHDSKLKVSSREESKRAQ